MRDLAQLFQAKTMKVVEDTTKKLKIVEHLQVRLLLKLYRLTEDNMLGCDNCEGQGQYPIIKIVFRSWLRRQNTSPCGWIVTERARTLASR